MYRRQTAVRTARAPTATKLAVEHRIGSTANQQSVQPHARLNRSRSAVHPILKESSEPKYIGYGFIQPPYKHRFIRKSVQPILNAVHPINKDVQSAQTVELTRGRTRSNGPFGRSEHHPVVPPTQGRYDRTPVEPRSQCRFIRLSWENISLHPKQDSIEKHI